MMMFSQIMISQCPPKNTWYTVYTKQTAIQQSITYLRLAPETNVIITDVGKIQMKK